MRGGVILISVYLWVTEGLATRNLAIRYAAGDAIARYQGPWVIGGDFNTTPSDLEQASEWLRQVRGRIIAPSVPTSCRRNVIDFFVVDQRIAGAV